jgi:5-methylcytosine-specific restriction enzyme A
MIKELFSQTLSQYRAAKTETFARHPLADILRHQLPKSIAAGIPQYLVVGSPGQGNWAEIPWVCVFDRSITESAEKGFYIVYLFDAAMSGVYLSLNQGWTQYERRYGIRQGREEVKKNVRTIQSTLRTTLGDFSFDPIGLHAEGTLGRGYEDGHICGKLYEVSHLPDDVDILVDLRNMLSVYRELKGLIGTDVFNINAVIEAESEDDPNPSPSDLIKVEERFRTASSAAEIARELGRLERELQSCPPQVQRRLARAIARNRTIARLTKERAKFRCEICHIEGFEKRDGSLYAEIHHVKELGRSGPDLPSNLICVCPTCHRKLHFGREAALRVER